MNLMARQSLFRPPAPKPLSGPPDTFALLKALRTNPLLTWTEEHFREPIVARESVLGRVTVLNDPGAIRHVLLDNAANYGKDDLQRRVLAPGLGKGLLVAEGDEWRLQRRTLAPLFAPRNVAGFQTAMVEAAERFCERLARRPEGRPVDIALEMTRVTLDVLERTIFTHGLASDPDALGSAITHYFDALGRVDPLDVFGVPAWVPRIGRWRARPALRFFDQVVGELIGNRKKLLENGGTAPRDILTLLLEASDPETGKGLTDIEVRANVITFIGAGHETTANALTWSLYLVSQDESVRERLEAEVDAVLGAAPLRPEDLDRLVFTRAVLKEAMRLYPPVPFMSRAPMRDDFIGNFRIPRGTLVTIAPWVLHRHKTLWQEPDAFTPDRFVPERRGDIDRFAYLPFGAGPRVCIGASFALQEATILLASILRRVRLDAVPEHAIEPVHRVTLRPKGGLPMRVARRR